MESKQFTAIVLILLFSASLVGAEQPRRWPILGMTRADITSDFGYREDGFGGREGFHFAIDVAAPRGTLVLATHNGVVVDHFPPPDGWYRGHEVYGGCALIVSDDGWATFYAHLSASYVREGQRVTAGQMIGRVGSTGLSTGNHLHYEILNDPLRYTEAMFAGVEQ